jgi:hypothetical protein
MTQSMASSPAGVQLIVHGVAGSQLGAQVSPSGRWQLKLQLVPAQVITQS